ncbi:MAG: response regulator [bacterium]|nr:response regulator [bacterium]
MNEEIKILLVEDDTFLLNMYADKFRSEGFEVVIAENGVEAIQMANAEVPDIILLDIMLPKKNGFEVLAELKNNKITKAIPVILLTNLSQRDEVKKGMELGAVDFLIKAHFMPNEVVEKVKKLINS